MQQTLQEDDVGNLHTLSSLTYKYWIYAKRTIWGINLEAAVAMVHGVWQI